MAKRKRASHEKPFSRPMPKPEADTVLSDSTLANSTDPNTADPNNMADQEVVEQSEEVVEQSEEVAEQSESAPAEATPAESTNANSEVAVEFISKWNRLISTTNWEKGQIICAWRDALIAADAAVTEYSDETWAQVVGGVTSQHVGRLRRVYQIFGDVSTQYETLHWSHFQACLDWDDAEMWLEGSIQNGWSVSQMRGKRWEVVGSTPEQQQAEVDQLAAEQQSELQAEEEQAQAASADLDPTKQSNSTNAEDNAFNQPADGPADERPDFGDEDSDAETAEVLNKRTRLSVDVESLPDDIAEAFESFKLAIIAHRRENWRDTTPESVVECLESLKELAMAEADIV